VNYNNSLVVTITVTCYKKTPSSGELLFACGAISRPPQQSQPRPRACHSWELQDQPLAICGQVDTACVFSTEPSTCTRSVFCCVRPSGNEI